MRGEMYYQVVATGIKVGTHVWQSDNKEHMQEKFGECRGNNQYSSVEFQIVFQLDGFSKY